MISYGALQPDGAWSPTMNPASGIGDPQGGLGSLMVLLRSNMGSSATGIPNAPSAASGASGAAQNRIGLGNTTLGWQTPNEGSGANGGGTWFGAPTGSRSTLPGPQTQPQNGLAFQNPGMFAGSTNNSQAAPLGGPSGWFPGQGQGFTFFGQQTPTQVGTNQFVWGNPNVPGAGVPGGGSPSTNTSSLQNLMQLVSTLQNNMNSLQQQRTTQPVAQQAPPPAPPDPLLAYPGAAPWMTINYGGGA